MLRTLRIRDLAVVEDVTIEFGAGLNLLTGETGAGKSIVVQALGLVAGARADRDAVRAGAERAVVEALFEISDNSPLPGWADEHGLEPIVDRQFLVRREVSVTGTGRAFANGSPVTQVLLREAGRLLVDLHGQHDHVRLLEADRQIELLDRFGGSERLAAEVAEAFVAVGAAEEELAAWTERLARREDRLDQLRRTVREIDAVAPREGEWEALASERRLLRSASRVAEGCQEILASTRDGDESAVDRVTRAARRAEELAEIDPTLLGAVERLRSAAIEIADVASEFEILRARLQYEPGHLDQIETRTAALQQLFLRHAADETGLLDLRASAAAEIAQLDDVDASRASREKALAEVLARYVAAAAQLTERRAAAAGGLSAAVTGELEAVALAGAVFEVQLDPRLVDGAPVRHRRGGERVEFVFAANPGEPARGIATAASGGELSRLLLALHVVLGPTLGADVAVFDEVDAGVGGTIAYAVGARLAEVAQGRQVICVSHLPQIAAWADRHLGVSKSVSDGRTRIRIESLASDERIEELARMLAGRRATASSRQHAAELLRTTEEASEALQRRRA